MKRSVDDLAVFGGRPAFAEPLHVGRPNVGDRDRLRARLDDMLDRRWLTNDGLYVEEFERRLAELAGTRHCVAVCNATVGLEIVVRALGLSGEVVVPSFTFVATAHALHWQGLTPVFCDIDPATHTLDPARVEALIGPRTSALIGVHLWGRACDVDTLSDIARRRGLALVFDAAHALGCTAGGRPVGSFGDAEVFSFHATKFVNSFEGGAVVTDDDRLAARVRSMKNFGFAGYDEVTGPGTNGKMAEVCAAMGLTSLEGMAGFIAVNRVHHQAYRERLYDVPGLRLLEYDDAERSNHQYVVVEVDEGRTGLGRDALLGVLHAENVLARRYFHPGCHRMEPYRSLYPDVGGRLPVTERIASRVLTLPTGTGVSGADVATVCDLIRFAVEHGAAVEGRLARAGAGVPSEAT